MSSTFNNKEIIEIIQDDNIESFKERVPFRFCRLDNMLFFAINCQSKKIIDVLLDEEKVDVTIQYKNFIPALQMAIREGDKKNVCRLITLGADVNGVAKDGHTALTIAIEFDQIEIAFYLITIGADVNLCGKNVFPPLVGAIFSPDAFLLIPLLIKEGADVNFEAGKSHSPLQTALLRDDFLIIEILHKAGCNLKGCILPRFLRIRCGKRVKDYLEKHGAVWEK